MLDVGISALWMYLALFQAAFTYFELLLCLAMCTMKALPVVFLADIIVIKLKLA